MNTNTEIKLTDLVDSKGKPKIAPVQGYIQGIPWSIHLEAYDAYCKRWGKQDALIDLEGRGCRGGFSVGELDMLIPNWRDRVGEISDLRAEVARLQAALAERDAKQVQGELPPLPDYDSSDDFGFSCLYTAEHMQSYARAAIAQRVGCGEPVEDTEQETYDYACHLMEQGWKERAKRGVEIGTQGSLCDGIAWIFDHMQTLETTPPAAVTDADKRDAGRWQPIANAPSETFVLVAGKFGNEGWRIKLASLVNGKWNILGASWKPLMWMPLPSAPDDAAIAASEQANKREDTTK